MEEINGDILDIEEGVIFHQVNCKGKMGAGLAGQIAKRYSKVKLEYLKKVTNTPKKELLGHVQSIKVGDNKYVLNSFTQEDYGRNPNIKYTEEELLVDNISKVVKIASKKGLKVYIPYKIGCGLGNGNWEYVKSRIEDLDITVVKYEK